MIDGHAVEVTATATLTLPPDPRAVAEARRLAKRTCAAAALDAEVCDIAVLLTSETVTNAVVHARTEVRLAVTAGPDGVRVEVADDDTTHPRQRDTDPDDPASVGGRGIAIIAAAATRWGVETRGTGKIVWFELIAR